MSTIAELQKEIEELKSFHEYETHMLRKQLADLREGLHRKFQKELHIHLENISSVINNSEDEQVKSLNVEINLIKSII
jgi:hypothetical protein